MPLQGGLHALLSLLAATGGGAVCIWKYAKIVKDMFVSGQRVAKLATYDDCWSFVKNCD